MAVSEATPSRSSGPKVPTWRQVLVKLRDLETDERTLLVREGWEARGDQAIRTHLVNVVLELRPRARPRSYHGGVASFVDGKHLIVARYGDAVPAPADERPPGSEFEQRSLFVDAA